MRHVGTRQCVQRDRHAGPRSFERNYWLNEVCASPRCTVGQRGTRRTASRGAPSALPERNAAVGHVTTKGALVIFTYAPSAAPVAAAHGWPLRQQATEGLETARPLRVGLGI